MTFRAPGPDRPPPVRAATLRELFGPGVAAATALTCDADDALFAEERAHIVHARANRRAEFATARVCARRALAELGVAPCALVPYPDRSPRWPAGIHGTIAHAGGCCAVAVTDAPHIRAIGLDIEPDVPLDPALERIVCTDAERGWLDRAGGDRGALGKLLFCAKEAWYKCQYVVTGTLLDFREVTLAIDLANARFRAVDGGIADIEGRFARTDGFVIVTTTLTER